MKYFSHIHSAVEIIGKYNGNGPFSLFIKNFFRQHRKFGSTDRRTITHLCYCYFRLGQSLKNIPGQEKILTGLFLCNNSPNDLLEYFKPEWNRCIHLPVAEKLSIVNCQLSITDIFSWTEELSNHIDYEKFCASFLIQPDLFVRIRPHKNETVLKKLTDANIPFRQINDSCLALDNSTKLDEVIDINKEAIIQDYNSQQVAGFFQPQTTNHQPQTVWDCCAASGGKSIMFYDIYPDSDLTVSDIREPILMNLGKRFAEAGIKKYQSFVADLSTTNYKPQTANYDMIIADVPCSGSGTWSRNPESVFFFDKNEIEKFSGLQKKIVANVIPSLKKGGRLIYITCSVFKKENEDVVEFIREKLHLQLEKMELLTGYENKADTMFVASFIKEQ